MDGPDRRTDHERRRRVDQLIARVESARAEILEAGLAAVRRATGAQPATAGSADARGRTAISGR
jgi:hypothetical protein